MYHSDFFFKAIYKPQAFRKIPIRCCFFFLIKLSSGRRMQVIMTGWKLLSSGPLSPFLPWPQASLVSISGLTHPLSSRHNKGWELKCHRLQFVFNIIQIIFTIIILLLFFLIVGHIGIIYSKSRFYHLKPWVFVRLHYHITPHAQFDKITQIWSICIQTEPTDWKRWTHAVFRAPFRLLICIHSSA